VANGKKWSLERMFKRMTKVLEERGIEVSIKETKKRRKK